MIGVETSRIIATFALLCVVIPGACIAAQPLMDLPPRPLDAPALQVLVIPATAPAQDDQINCTYATVVSRAQVDRDMSALVKSSSWPLRNMEVSDQALPMAGVRTLPMTSVTLSAPGLIGAGQQYLPLEPFVSAFRGYGRMAVTFLMPTQFSFSGLREFRNKNVDIILRRQGSTYTYTVHVLDPRFTTLGLPTWQPDPSRVQLAAATRPSRTNGVDKLRIVGVVLVTLAAGLVGLGVYLFLNKGQ